MCSVICPDSSEYNLLGTIIMDLDAPKDEGRERKQAIQSNDMVLKV